MRDAAKQIGNVPQNVENIEYNIYLGMKCCFTNWLRFAFTGCHQGASKYIYCSLSH